MSEQIYAFFTSINAPFFDFVDKEYQNSRCCDEPTFFRCKSKEKIGQEVSRHCIHDILDSRMVITFTPDEVLDMATIPNFNKIAVFLTDELALWHKRQYLLNMYKILKGSLPLKTDINQLSDIQVLLLLRGSAYSDAERLLWNQKLRPRFPYIDAMILLEYV